MKRSTDKNIRTLFFLFRVEVTLLYGRCLLGDLFLFLPPSQNPSRLWSPLPQKHDFFFLPEGSAEPMGEVEEVADATLLLFSRAHASSSSELRSAIAMLCFSVLCFALLAGVATGAAPTTPSVFGGFCPRFFVSNPPF